MAITIGRRRGRGIPAASVEAEPVLRAPEPLPIGLPDLDVIGCPICARPIAAGTGRCPGCGTRLVFNVPLRRAGIFVGLGVALGLIAGGTAGVWAGRPGASSPAVAAAPTAAPATQPSTAPGAVPPTAAASTTPGPSSAASGQAVAALAQVLVVDGRLAARTAELRAELAAKPFEPFAVATTLRALSADAVVGIGVVRLLDAWPDASDLGSNLRDYYARVSGTASATLAAS
ncbi:MAG TPA: hypothetical protein VFR93_06010, partial [Candidatus Limnocylindrales bacterium]|nr:hypothetical protein [Candidatus Limnocylindrales bacterium]